MMAQGENPRPLTADEKRVIWKTIYDNMAPDDREPQVVIDDRYGGSTEKYLRAMAGGYGIRIGG